MDWAAFYYLEGGLLFGFVAAAGLTGMSLVRPYYKIARRCAWVASILFGSIAVVWGLTTMESALIRIPAVGIAGFVAVVCLTEALRFIAKHEATSQSAANAAQAQPAPVPAQSPAPPPLAAAAPAPRGPTLEATRHSKIDATGAVIPGDLPFQFGRADDHSVIDMPGTVVTRREDGTYLVQPSAIPVTKSFPAPTGEFSHYSNPQLRDTAKAMAANLRDFQRREMEEWSTLPRLPQGGVDDDVFQKFANKWRVEYETKYLNQAFSIASEIMNRIGTVTPETRNERSGAMMLLHKSFAGSRPAVEVADFLDLIAGKLLS